MDKILLLSDAMALRVQNGKLQRQIDLLRRWIKMDANEYEKKINDLSLDNRALRFQNEKLQNQIKLYEGILENIFIEVN